MVESLQNCACAAKQKEVFIPRPVAHRRHPLSSEGSQLALNEKYRYSHSGETIASSIASDCVSLSSEGISGMVERSRVEIGIPAFNCRTGVSWPDKRPSLTFAGLALLEPR